MPLLKLSNEECKHITAEELHEEFIKEFYWFVFKKYYLFSSINWHDSDQSYIEHQKSIEEDKKKPLEKFRFKSIEELFKHPSIKRYKDNGSLIRYELHNDELIAYYLHDQSIDGYDDICIGNFDERIADEIHKYIIIDEINGIKKD